MNKNKIFIIEDDYNLLSGLEAKLNLLEFEVFTESGLSEGAVLNSLRQIKIIQPKFIILDLTLPAVDGFEILSKIKSDEEISHIPVFVFSDLSEEDYKKRSADLGAEHFFVKNEMNLDEFLRRVLKIYKRL